MSIARLDIIRSVDDDKNNKLIDSLINDCQWYHIDTVVSSDIREADLAGKSNGILFMKPCTKYSLFVFYNLFNGLLDYYDTNQFDNFLSYLDINTVTDYSRLSCISKAIYNVITSKFKHSSASISVVGRDKHAVSLINALIKYGYTVFEFNTRSDFNKDSNVKSLMSSDVIVGLEHSQNMINIDNFIGSNALIIDYRNNFITQDHRKIDNCDKWIIDTIIDQVKLNASNGLVVPEDAYKYMEPYDFILNKSFQEVIVYD